jgi:hypothetical protein
MRILKIPLLLALAAAGLSLAADITIQRPNFSVAAYIRNNGRVEDESFRTLGYLRDDGRVEDARFQTLGYLRDGGRVEDARFATIGYVRTEGRIEDSRFKTVGYVRDGTIQDDGFKTVAHFETKVVNKITPVAIAAYLFFFSPALFPDAEWERALKAGG